MADFRPVYAQGDMGSGIGGYDLRASSDQVFAFDYTSTGKLDHLVLYRPGSGTIWILAPGASGYTPVYREGSPGKGIGGYDLKSTTDRVFAFDYDSTGNLDHLVLYRPGTGTIWILKRDSTGFSPVYREGWPGNGIGGYNLRSAADRAFAFDYLSTGNLDHLVLYRPGTGTIWILRRDSTGFSAVYRQGDPGSGIGGYDLKSTTDRVLAFDYLSTGNLDHLVLYRPGTGKISILKRAGSGFGPVYEEGDPGKGIGGYDLTSPADQVVAVDGASSGKLDHLALYRPGTGKISILQRDDAGFSPMYQDGSPGKGIGGYDLRAAADRVFAFDGASSGKADRLGLYRPGRGAIFLVRRVLVRRDVWTLRSAAPWDPITEAYARAVGVMQARAADDPTSWTYQAAMHGTSATQESPLWNGCQHSSWYFLPWHRMYVHYFERIVRAAALTVGAPEDFALPYWNYDQPDPANTLPEPFRVATLPDGSANPLYIPAPGRKAGIMSGLGLPKTATSATDALAFTNFSNPDPGQSFGGGQDPPAQFGTRRGALEQTPHNVVHGLVGTTSAPNCSGGLMNTPLCAALDPIFWLHHANIDRLWQVWLDQGGGRIDPTETDWLTQSFSFYDETGTEVSLTGADVVETARQLGYVYQ